MSIILHFFFLLCPLLLLFFAYNRFSSKKARLPPSPPKIPLIGNLHQLGSQPHRSLHALAKKHGPLMFLKLGDVPTVVASSGEVAEEILKKQDQNFANRPSLELVRRLVYDSNGLIFSRYGENWRQLRKISVVHLLSAKRVQSFRRVREQEVARAVEKVKHESRTGPVNVSKLLYGYANDILLQVTVGKKYHGENGDSRFFKVIDENIALLGTFYVGDFLPYLGWVSKLTGLDARVKRNFENWDKLLDEVIDDHLHAKRELDDERGDLVDVLLSLNEDQSSDFTLTRENIKATIMDMFAGGTDTSYIAMEWTMAELAHNPTILCKVQDEIRRVVAGKPMVEEEDISQMPYLKAVLKEALRMYPPGPLLLPRESIEATTIQGYEIPAESRVIVNAWAIGRDPNSWDAPDEFRPERFLDNSIGFQGQDFHYIPFGAGRRSCPGMQFALLSVELTLANLLYHFDWKMPDGKNPEDLDMVEAYGLTMRMGSSLFLDAVPRLV